MSEFEEHEEQEFFEIDADVVADEVYDDEYLCINEDVEADPEKVYKETKKKTTLPFLTKYERARLIGIRAEHISLGAPPLVKLEKGIIDPIEIAIIELKMKKIPIIIRRYLPDDTYEDWKISELNTDILY